MGRWRRDDGAAMVMVILASLVGAILVASGLRLAQGAERPLRQLPRETQSLLNAQAGRTRR